MPTDRASTLFRSAQDIGVAVVAAALILIATPPVDLWPLGLVGLVVLHLGTRDLSPGRALFVGWLCGFVVNAIAFSWGSDLLRRFVHIDALQGGLVVLGLAAYQAVVFALWVGGAAWMHSRLHLPRLVSAPLAIVVAEAAVPFVFPWYLAIVVAPAWPLLQVAELGGPPAVSGLIVLLTAVIAEALLLVGPHAQPGSPDTAAASGGSGRTLGTSLHRILTAGFGLRTPPSPRHVRLGAIVVAAVIAMGLLRAGHVALARRAAPTLRVGVVQPNFGIVSAKDRAERGADYMGALRGATAMAAQQGAELIVWPESAFPFLFDRDLEREYPPGHPWELRSGHHGRLLVGALTHQFGTSVVDNSVVLVSGNGSVAGIYDKTRLLAFGEYVPFAERYPGWAAAMRARMADWPEIVPGDGPRILVDGNLRIAPLICYEDLLADYVHQAARRGPNLLVTSANHAWFGTTAAARQALALALLRGVETRRDLVRATTTGVSSISDALGRVSRTSHLVGPSQGSQVAPEILVGDVALVEVFAVGPYVAWLFPYLCGIALLWSGSRSYRRRGRRSDRCRPGT